MINLLTQTTGIRLLLLASLILSLTDSGHADPQAELRGRLSKTLEARIARRVTEFIRTKEQAPEKSKAFRLKVDLSLASDQASTATLSDNMKPSALIAAIRVLIQLRFKPKDPTFDIDLKHIIEKELGPGIEGEQMTVTRHPKVEVNVTFAQSLTHIGEEIRRDLILIAITMMILFVLIALSQVPKKVPVVACPSTIQAAHNIEVATQVPPPPSRPNPTKKAPTPELLNTYRTINEEQINPLEGSWHLQALPRLTPDLLQSTFETMPLQEAIAMIRAVPSGYREDLANKLNLNPTLKARVLASSNEKRLRPKSPLKILGLQKV